MTSKQLLVLLGKYRKCVLSKHKTVTSASLWLTSLSKGTNKKNNPKLLFVYRDCRVVKDMATGKSKGYGFVSFFNKWVWVPSFPYDCPGNLPAVIGKFNRQNKQKIETFT